MEKNIIAALATQRALGHLGEGAPSDGVTPEEKLLRAIFGARQAPGAQEAAAAAAAETALEESRARWANSPDGELAAARQAAQAAEWAAADAAAAAERVAVVTAKVARVAMVNAAIATLVADGILADHDYARQPRVGGLRWSEKRGEVVDENSHDKSPPAWALYKRLRDEGTTCPDRAADLLAEICGLLEEPK